MPRKPLRPPRPRKGHARHVLKPRARDRPEMCGRHSAGPKRRFGLGNEGLVDILEDEVQHVAGPSPESVAHETRDPNCASFVEGKSVGERSSAECDDRLGRSEEAVRTQREADQTSTERFDGVKPTAGRIDTDFVGVVESVCDDAGASVLDKHDETVGDVATPCSLPWALPGAHRNPEPAESIGRDEVRRRQIDAVHLLQHGAHRAVATQAPHATGVFPEMGHEEPVVAVERKPVGLQSKRAWLTQPRRVVAVGADPRDPAPPVGDEHAADGIRDDALRAMQAFSPGIQPSDERSLTLRIR